MAMPAAMPAARAASRADGAVFAGRRAADLAVGVGRRVLVATDPDERHVHLGKAVGSRTLT